MTIPANRCQNLERRRSERSNKALTRAPSGIASTQSTTIKTVMAVSYHRRRDTTSGRRLLRWSCDRPGNGVGDQGMARCERPHKSFATNAITAGA
jgi:hypothetical protein